jgi:RHH-type proline utilization regulon transcriptional repressor/proline dehydrogenase/delta 1-pyrroline-5-carboxylate dehydrogenase
MAQTSDARNLSQASPALPGRDEIASYHLMDEVRLVGALIERAVYTTDERRRIADTARRLVHAVRATNTG